MGRKLTGHNEKQAVINIHEVASEAENYQAFTWIHRASMLPLKPAETIIPRNTHNSDDVAVADHHACNGGDDPRPSQLVVPTK